MALKHNLLAASYPFLKFKSSVQEYFKNPNGSLRVLVYHNINPDEIISFRSQMLWLKKNNWKFIHPTNFSKMITGEEEVIGKNLLLTFDDGFKSNKIVAENVLKPLQISALFFIVSGFADLTNINESHNFISKGIRSDLDPSDMPKHWENMNWKDLEFLLDNNHLIGAHTFTHPKLSKIIDETILEHEIIKSADFISAKLGMNVDHFAFTFGDAKSISQEAYKVAMRRFKFIYTSIRGDNVKNNSPFFITRETASPVDSRYLLGSFLEGGADLMYKKAKDNVRSFL